MGTYTTEEFLDTFGGLPDWDDHQWAGPDPDAVRDQQKYAEQVELPDDHPGFIDCRCGIGVRADRFICPACGSET